MNYEKTPLYHGYADQILTIDLESGDIESPEIDPEVRDFFIGGRGLGLYLLHKVITEKTTAYDPENPLILANGPLGGIPQFPGTSKCMAVSLPPLTGIAGISNFGGYFGAFLKYAGFDALEVTGKSASRCMIIIDSFKNEVTITDAPAMVQVFDLETAIVDRFVKEGHDKRNIVFVTAGVGAANTTFGCINSHYYDVAKPVDGTSG